MRLSKLNRTLLLESIAHWIRMARGKARPDERPTGRHCALCRQYVLQTSCKGCPVHAHTRREMCHDTPFDAASDAYWTHGAHSRQFKQAARKELAFLKSLL